MTEHTANSGNISNEMRRNTLRKISDAYGIDFAQIAKEADLDYHVVRKTLTEPDMTHFDQIREAVMSITIRKKAKLEEIETHLNSDADQKDLTLST